MSHQKLYWDAGLFICFLNRAELERRAICEDVLYHAKDGAVSIYTSAWTIAEVVRPGKSLPGAKALTTEQAKKISDMFEWSEIYFSFVSNWLSIEPSLASSATPLP